jgi:hypothetical protein
MERKRGRHRTRREAHDLPREMTDPPLRRDDDEASFHPGTADALIERECGRRGTVMEYDRHIRVY